MISFAAFAAWAALGLSASNHYWAGSPSPCPHTYVAMVADGGEPMAGQWIDPNGTCIIWINAAQGPFDGTQICKLIVHEDGHLRGKQHSTDPRSVMFAPYRSTPMPYRCRAANGKRRNVTR